MTAVPLLMVAAGALTTLAALWFVAEEQRKAARVRVRLAVHEVSVARRKGRTS